MRSGDLGAKHEKRYDHKAAMAQMSFKSTVIGEAPHSTRPSRSKGTGATTQRGGGQGDTPGEKRMWERAYVSRCYCSAVGQGVFESESSEGQWRPGPITALGFIFLSVTHWVLFLLIHKADRL